MGLLITEEGRLVYCDGVKLYDIEINCDENKIELKENRSIFFPMSEDDKKILKIHRIKHCEHYI